MAIKLEINRGFTQYKIYDDTPESTSEFHCYRVTCSKRTLNSKAYTHHSTINSIYAKTAQHAYKLFKKRDKL